LNANTAQRPADPIIGLRFKTWTKPTVKDQRCWRPALQPAVQQPVPTREPPMRTCGPDSHDPYPRHLLHHARTVATLPARALQVDLMAQGNLAGAGQQSYSVEPLQLLLWQRLPQSRRTSWLTEQGQQALVEGQKIVVRRPAASCELVLSARHPLGQAYRLIAGMNAPS
jgi:hypothetical protein